MSARLRLHFGQRGPKSIDAERGFVRASDDFGIELHNHGHPLHVHILPQNDLARFVSLEATNIYLERDEVRTITAAVADRRPKHFDGKLRVATGFGVETTYVDIRLRDQPEYDREVVVDEALASPRSGESATPRTVVGLDAVPILALAAIALLVALGATMIATNVAVTIGVIAVVLGVAIAVFVMLR